LDELEAGLKERKQREVKPKAEKPASDAAPKKRGRPAKVVEPEIDEDDDDEDEDEDEDDDDLS
jgi:hypothetical protein